MLFIEKSKTQFSFNFDEIKNPIYKDKSDSKIIVFCLYFREI